MLLRDLPADLPRQNPLDRRELFINPRLTKKIIQNTPPILCLPSLPSLQHKPIIRLADQFPIKPLLTPTGLVSRYQQTAFRFNLPKENPKAAPAEYVEEIVHDETHGTLAPEAQMYEDREVNLSFAGRMLRELEEGEMLRRERVPSSQPSKPASQPSNPAR